MVATGRVIALVGPCASGKSTLGRALRELGYVVREPAQEHSFVPDMWERLSKPDVLIYLDVSLEAISRRGRLGWTRAYLDEQRQRLRHARQHADWIIRTDDLTEQEVLTQVLAFLSVDR